MEGGQARAEGDPEAGGGGRAGDLCVRTWAMASWSHSPPSPWLTQGGDQLPQVGGTPPLQALQGFQHLQRVAHAAAQRLVHAAQDGGRADAQPLAHRHLQAGQAGQGERWAQPQYPPSQGPCGGGAGGLTRLWASSRALSGVGYRAALPNLTSSTSADSCSAAFLLRMDAGAGVPLLGSRCFYPTAYPLPGHAWRRGA